MHNLRDTHTHISVPFKAKKNLYMTYKLTFDISVMKAPPVKTIFVHLVNQNNLFLICICRIQQLLPLFYEYEGDTDLQTAGQDTDTKELRLGTSTKHYVCSCNVSLLSASMNTYSILSCT